MSAIGGVSGGSVVSPSAVNSGGGADGQIEAIQKKIQDVMDEIKELIDDQTIEPKVKVKLLGVKQALIQAYQTQIMNIMNQEAQKATMEAVSKAELLDQINPADAEKEAQGATPHESAIVHIAPETLEAIREEQQEEASNLAISDQKQEETFDILLDRDRESISEYA